MYTTNSKGQRLFFETTGEGAPVILLPGSSQSHIAFIDSGLVAALEPHFTVCVMDPTGLGRSDRVTSMTTSQWAEDVISVMDAAAFPAAHLGGTTLGARVAARVAADHPDRVDTLLVDMPITSVTDEQEERISAMFVDYADSPLATGWQRWHGEQWREAMDFFVPTRAEPAFRAYYSPVDYIDRIEAPTFLCRSDEENLAHPLALAFEWHRKAKGSQLWIEPGATNAALTMACADEVARRYVHFVAACSGRRQSVGAEASSGH